MKEFEIRNRIWINGDEGTFLGNGRIQLLEKLLETGSINDAARALKMSYRKAWSLLESMNNQAPEPYVIKSTGGQGGGGTLVTKAGKKAIRNFRKLNQRCDLFLEKEMKKIDF